MSRADGLQFLPWDLLGTAASALCLVHCVLTPFLLALSPTLTGFLPGSNTTHHVFVFFVVSLGLLAFFSGYKKHRRKMVLFADGRGNGPSRLWGVWRELSAYNGC